MLKCPICNSYSSSLYYKLYDDRYGFPDQYNLFSCNSCKHKYLEGEFTPEILKNLYTNYYPRSNWSIEKFKPREEVKGINDWYKGLHRSAYAYVPKNVRVLDIGCGFGETLAYHQNKGCEVYGVEADENIKRVAEKFGFNVHAGLFDASMYERDFFDFVTMDQVIEHVLNPYEVLDGIAKILKPGGTAILSTPNANGWGAKFYKNKWLHWHTPYHLQFFSKKSMKIVTDKIGLKLFKTKYATLSDWYYWQKIHLIFFPKMGEASLFWKHMSKKYYDKDQIAQLEKLEKQRRAGIISLKTRTLDTFSLGDNYMFFLRKNK